MCLFLYLNYLACLLNFAISIPLNHAGDEFRPPPLTITDGLDPLRAQFRGIYWDVVKTTCETDDFNILVEASRMAVEITNYRTGVNWSSVHSAAWNRYFVDDSGSSQGGWQGVSCARIDYILVTNKYPERR